MIFKADGRTIDMSCAEAVCGWYWPDEGYGRIEVWMKSGVRHDFQVTDRGEFNTVHGALDRYMTERNGPCTGLFKKGEEE